MAKNNILTTYRVKINTMHDIPSNRKPFYIRWVEKFLNWQANRKVSIDLSSKHFRVFIEHLREDKNYSDWQIDQAMDALNILNSMMATMIEPRPLSEDAVFEKIHEMIYTHVILEHRNSIKSPLDYL